MFSAYFKTLSGKDFFLPVNLNTTCADLLPEISKKLNIPEDDINLFFRSKHLKKNKKIFDLMMKKQDYITIHQGDSFFRPLIPEQKSNSYPRATKGQAVPTYEEYHHLNVSYKDNVIEEEVPEVERIDFIDSDPTNFESVVKDMMELGFPKDKIIDIMRRYNYDQATCIDILLSGKEPEQRRDVVYDVSDLNLYDFGEFSVVLDELNNHEKYDLLTLCRTHEDPMNIIQIFIACDKNIEASEHALLG